VLETLRGTWERKLLKVSEKFFKKFWFNGLAKMMGFRKFWFEGLMKMMGFTKFWFKRLESDFMGFTRFGF
jgi:hypothetical protein